MNFIMAMGIILLAIIKIMIVTVIIVVVGISLANYIKLTGVIWWAFVILFYLTVTSILGIKQG